MQQIVILGGGAAGLAAALAAAQSAPAGAVRVTVLDRNPRCGKKLLATGNGRCNLDNTGIAPEQYFTADPAALRHLLAAVDAAAPLEWFAAKSRALKYLGHLTPEEMRRVDDAVRISLALNPMGSIQQIEPIRRSTAVYAPPEVVDGKPPVYPYTPIRSSFENAGSIEEMMLYTELQSAVHAMIQRLEYSFTFNPSLLTSPKRKQQVAEILEEAEKYIWRIKEEMRCA